MALLKTGVRYPIELVSSFTYVCSNEECEFLKTFVEGSKENCDICPICGCSMRLVSSHTESEDKAK